MFTRISLTLALSVSLTACGAGAEDEAAIEPPEAVGANQAALGVFRIDSSALAVRPAGRLPADPLTAAAFAPAHVADRLIGTAEVFDPSASFANRLVEDSATWHVENDAERGRLLVHRRDLSGRVAAPPAPAELSDLALRRLAEWGVPEAEISKVMQRTLMRQDLDEPAVDAAGAPVAAPQPSPPMLHRHKTFVQRGIGGIPVEGHRAVVTYRPDGVFQRALLAWPPLAADGHRMTSALPVAEIERRVIAELQAEGETEGEVALRWKYVPTLLADGSVTLELMVSARLAEVVGRDLTEEARIFDIPVDAI